jgi:predicted dithiol-disulfide oxidoreductase (DUF899 family)
MVEVAANSLLLGPHGPVTFLDTFEGRRQLIAYYFMWWPGRAAAEQCEGCTWVMSHVGELAYLHSREITFAVLSQGRNTANGPGDGQASYDESLRYRAFMDWDMPWYSAQPSLDTLLVGRQHGLFHLVCYLRDGDRVFETYWTKCRGAEVLDYSYALMDLTVYGRQEEWEDSPAGWPRRGHATRTVGGAPAWPPLWEWPGGRPTSQWPRLDAGYSDDLGDRGRRRSTASESLPLTGLPERPRRVLRCYGSASAASQSMGVSLLIALSPPQPPPGSTCRHIPKRAWLRPPEYPVRWLRGDVRSLRRNDQVPRRDRVI